MDEELYGELWKNEQVHWWFRGRREIVRSLVMRYARPKTGQALRICELGCGTGGNIAAWAGAHDVMGVDASVHALKLARRRLGARVRFGRLPSEIPLPPESFDVILMTDVLEHVEEDAASVGTALSLLRLGGILVATAPAHQWLYSPRDRQHQHVRRYSKARFHSLFDMPEANVELLSFYNCFLSPAAVAARLWSKLGANKPGATYRPTHRPAGDLRVPPALINRLLTAVFSLERHLLGRTNLPCGLSVIAVIRKSGRRPLAAAG